MSTGRQVAVGRLWRTRGDTVKERVRVVLHCGSPDCTNHGQLNIYDEDLSANKPSRTIPLHLVRSVQCLNTTHPSPPATHRPSSRDFRMSMTETQLNQQPGSLWGLMLLLQTGEGVELYAEAREEQQLWIKYLSLLAMYPYSPFPEEPRVCPIKESFRARLNPANFDADSVWAVYILPEEVGTRIQALGMQYLMLQSSLSQRTTATLKIISPLDMEPIVTWEALKIRRTGHLGNLMFIEVGRRCEGGPGLLWMCTTPLDAQSFKETLQRFVYSGDGRPVLSANSSNKQLHSDQQLCSYNQRAMITRMSSGSSSFGLSSSPSSQPSSTSSSPGTHEDMYEYAYAGFTGKRSAPQAIMHTGSRSQYHTPRSYPFSSTPPPINLSTHPRINKSLRRSSGELSDSSSMESPSSGQLFPSAMITLLEDLDMEDSVSSLQSSSGAVAHLMRTQSLPGGSPPSKQRRSNTTSTCQPTHYLKVTHPEVDPQDEYVFMRPGQRPARQREVSSKQESKATLTHSNYDILEPLHLTKSTHEDRTSDYENSFLPPDIATATPIVYQPSYQNFTPSHLTRETPQLHPVTGDDPSSVEATNIDSAKHSKSDEIQSAWDELENLSHILENFMNQ